MIPDARGHVRLSKIQKMEAVDDHTVKIWIDKPNGDFIYVAAVGTDAYQISPTAWGEDGSTFHENPVGTGAFMFKSHEPQSEIQYVANPNYWQGAPLLDGLTIRIHGDTTVRLIEVESENVHYVDGIEPEDAVRLQNEGRFVVNTPVGPGVTMISVNTSRYPMTELSLRQALAHAIDFDAIIEEVLFGLPQRSRGGVSPNSPYWTDDLPPIAPYDRSGRARIWTKPAGCRPMTASAIANATWTRRTHRSLRNASTGARNWWSTSSRPTSRSGGCSTRFTSSILTDIGIDAPIKTAEWNAMLDEWRENQGNWTFGHHSQGSFFAVTSAIEASWAPDSFWSIYQIDDATDPYLVEVAEELQATFDAFSATTDLEERKRLSHQAQTDLPGAAVDDLGLALALDQCHQPGG